jgi:hypothetical protein
VLSDHGVFAYLVEFMTFATEVGLVAQAIGTEFQLPSQEAFEKRDGHHWGKAIHFSIPPESNGAVVVLVTISIAFLNKIEALKMEPSPPWHVFPNEAPSTLGSCKARWIIGGTRCYPFFSASPTPNSECGIGQASCKPGLARFFGIYACLACRSAGGWKSRHILFILYITAAGRFGIIIDAFERSLPSG